MSKNITKITKYRKKSNNLIVLSRKMIRIFVRLEEYLYSVMICSAADWSYHELLLLFITQMSY